MPPTRRDNLTPEQRSFAMSRVKNKNTALELRVMAALRARGVRFRKHVATLPGRPDIVFVKQRVALFVDGDFWHGYRFPAWRHQLSEFWRVKIALNRARDLRNFARLRRLGWTVIRLWQHQVAADLDAAIDVVLAVLARAERRAAVQTRPRRRG